MKTSRKTLATMTTVATMFTASLAMAQGEMSFFVTSTGLDGANYGGLEGADAHCQQLAEAAGAGGRTWAAYLSTQGDDAINARDRIGSGPWYNANGTMIAENIEALHQDDVNINHEAALDESGAMVPYVQVDDEGNALPREDQPGVEHDILTGTMADGTAFPADEDRTCGNWTSNGEGSAMVGHHDRRSLQPGLSPWNAAHPSRGGEAQPSRGCSQESLVGTGGAGRLYCFAAD
jgi:hypothetical protein